MADMDRDAGSAPNFVEEFAAAAEWFATHLARTSARAPVPTCEPWTVVDLTAHIGNTYAWAASVLETGEPAEVLGDRPPSARATRMSEWYLAKAEDLYEVLRSADPDAPCWNFAFGTGTAAFWPRRQAHETIVHGIDLARAGGYPERVPDRLALDGVAEILEVFLWRMHHRGHPAALHRAVELRATDFDVSWVVEPAGPMGIPAQSRSESSEAGGTQTAARTMPRVSLGHDAGADRVEATAGTLLKLLWKRVAPHDVDVRLVGDEDRILGFLRSRLTP